MNRLILVPLILMCAWANLAYADSYTHTSNAAISGHNKKKITGGLDACKNACVAETTFLCRSFDYDKKNESCDLSDMTESDVGGLKSDYANDPYDHYARDFSSDTDAGLQDHSASLRKEFSCSTPNDDGCSNPLNGKVTKSWKRLFKPACQVHDWCYSSPWRISGVTGYKGQKKCDDEFQKNMEAICSNRPNVERLDCWTQKTTYHLTVRDWGHKAFDQGQRNANRNCKFEESQKVKNGAITFFNSGGYVAKFVLTYVKPKIIEGIEIFIPVIKSKTLPIGKYIEWEIPTGSKSISVAAFSKTGLAWEPERLIVEESWGDVPRNQCIKVFGTTLHPKHNRVCDLFDI
ncbi:hypothetical protein NBRC116188_08730 [Oceaniserpentilla sp. 4NH20-0058]|uniref:phospholipase A2 n=1 Tax=Oceaniserpentilla sp. 4NH20-0058 TaxID=3127660 RepID=UPI003105B128